MRNIADVCDISPRPALNMDACNTTAPRTPAKKAKKAPAKKVSLLCDRGSLGAASQLVGQR